LQISCFANKLKYLRLPFNRSYIYSNISNIVGWRTTRKILTFESDDWGSIRTSNLGAVSRLSGLGIDFKSLDAQRYSYNDTLASAEDLTALFDVLSSVKDCNNHMAVFTAVSLVANPDFEAIRKSGYRNYYYEPFTDTLKRVPGCEGSFELWKQGIGSGIFIPQFHGREHLNITAWMRALKYSHPETLEVFNERMFGYVNTFFDARQINYQEAFNIHDPTEINFLEAVIADGLKLFENIFGYRARLFVAPNGPFPNILEKTLALNGITLISQPKIQHEPIGYGKTRKVFHYLGMKNKWNQVYLTRNCFFEPSNSAKMDWVGSCMRDVETAFRWNKPAIISSHRVNYIGRLNICNRQQNLKLLGELLTKIKNRWPDIEFMSSVQLGSLIIDN
jgi:hypothetical protein